MVPSPAPDEYRILSVPLDAAEVFESIGTKEKFWFTEAETKRQGLPERTGPS